MQYLDEEQQLRLECLKITEGCVDKAARLVDYVLGKRESDNLVPVAERLNAILRSLEGRHSLRTSVFSIETRMRDALVQAGMPRDAELPELAHHNFPITSIGGQPVRVTKMHADGPHSVEPEEDNVTAYDLKGAEDMLPIAPPVASIYMDGTHDWAVCPPAPALIDPNLYIGGWGSGHGQAQSEVSVVRDIHGTLIFDDPRTSLGGRIVSASFEQNPEAYAGA